MRRGIFQQVEAALDLGMQSLTHLPYLRYAFAPGDQQASFEHGKELGDAGSREIAPSSHRQGAGLTVQAVGAVFDQGHTMHITPVAHLGE